MPTRDAKYRDEICKYYSKLRNFIEITGHAQLTNSKRTKRAEKARSKLSSLSTRQFYELNLDVNDELDRRVAEEDSQSITLKEGEKEAVDKRNNARKKLAALNEVRFDELVNDLISEIELRGMDKILKSDYVDQKEAEGTLVSSFNMSDLDSITPKTINDLEINPNDELKDPSVDEIEETIDVAVIPDSLSNSPSESDILKPDNSQVNVDDMVLQSAVTTDTPNDISKSDPFFQTSHVVPIKASIDWSDDDEDESPTKMDQRSIVDIETKDNSSTTQDINFIKTTANNGTYESLLEENKKLKQELYISKMKQNNTTALAYLSIDSLNMDKMEQYVDNDLGYIPVHMAEKFHDTINYFYKVISDPEHIPASDKNDDESSPDTTLFKIVFQISKVCSQIITLVDIPIFKQELILLKAAISQAITTVRYYSMYGSLLPKLTVHAAIADISFSFCNLIKMTKLKTNTDLFQTSILSGVNNTPGSTFSFTKDLLNHNTKETDKIEVAAKPLKLARNLKNHKVDYQLTPSKTKTPVRNGSKRRSKRSSFRKSKQSDNEMVAPCRNPSRSASKGTNVLRESRQDSFDFNKTPTLLQNNCNQNNITQTNHSVSRNASISSSTNSAGAKSASTSIGSRKNSKSSSVKWKNNKKKVDHKHEKIDNNNGKPVAVSPNTTKSSKKSAKRFADKIKNFGNNNSLGLRMMPSEKSTKVK
ncbi:similar to Kazachstania africana hypothetical protein KAFR_0I01360 [Kazachstania africana CBS 2517] [Maudiozyma barnettii]|uniref:GIT Spa2 homology (SHD) domain-containing protein n=1 Tax=Maudiozyma barnettii TaxID=61262 RepID=A0A8H2VD10_9SACH|nr:similar to Kazachstania africana hypothetical protein KAFR_0I01360 [Kazachstania africana CBS 2517] [Kazachstania barnettii]CAB4253007.1 similar to Kazachstania africana hypothetical protein KAFR_0I01360 [Kazachstania africana CBS 2517] [Kazachstania barnettii]CAD1780141.1 similar to Kazachstania africana hypothetical protein KAFR_0I01360 [Kazachstania africana CBS 2517] [Kazachstania barnettii]